MRPDRDFGLYGVIQAKSAEVSQFLDKDLLPQVAAARLPREVSHALLTMLSVDPDPGVAGVAREALARQTSR